MLLEISDTNTIKKAQEAMAKALEKQFPHKQERTIGWPSGHIFTTVRFSQKSGTESRWWYTELSNDKETAFNAFGRGNPQDSKLLLIDLQFSLPVKNFSRRQGGVFIKDLSSGKMILGHRGIVTRGKSRVPRELLLSEANLTTKTVMSDSLRGEVDVLLVSPIDDANLGKKIGDFAVEVRRSASAVMADKEHKPTSDPTHPRKLIDHPSLDAILSSYYDEFIGKKTISRSDQVIMNCQHGIVVKALRDRLTKGRQYKSIAIDLAVETEDEVSIFEVKTGADSQSIYTGIGQLYFHAVALSNRFPGKKIAKYLVIPFSPSNASREKIFLDLGLKVVTFNIRDEKAFITSGL